MEMLGIRVDTLEGGSEEEAQEDSGWNEAERITLRAAIAARESFLDFTFSRINADGSLQQYRVSGEPMFNSTCGFIGYRGIGVEVTPRPRQAA